MISVFGILSKKPKKVLAKGIGKRYYKGNRKASERPQKGTKKGIKSTMLAKTFGTKKVSERY